MTPKIDLNSIMSALASELAALDTSERVAFVSALRGRLADLHVELGRALDSEIDAANDLEIGGVSTWTVGPLPKDTKLSPISWAARAQDALGYLLNTRPSLMPDRESGFLGTRTTLGDARTVMHEMVSRRSIRQELAS